MANKWTHRTIIRKPKDTTNIFNDCLKMNRLTWNDTIDKIKKLSPQHKQFIELSLSDPDLWCRTKPDHLKKDKLAKIIGITTTQIKDIIYDIKQEFCNES